MKKIFDKQQVIVYLCFSVFLFTANASIAKNKKPTDKNGYNFVQEIVISTSPVKDQASSGTCWSFATTSFIETELIRMGKGEHDISEMYFVRYIYPEKAKKFIRYQGMGNFSEGGQAHDVMNVIKAHGFVPEEAYKGLNYGYDYHNHSEIVDVLKGILSNSLKNKEDFSGKYLDLINASLDVYLDEVPKTFNYQGKDYTPASFSAEMGINSANYIEFTSYLTYPYNTKVDLEVPDNWSHDLYYNVTLDDLMSIINNAFANGYSVDWDGDVSDRGFSHKNGIAIVPELNIRNLQGNEQAKWESLSDSEMKNLFYDFSTPRKEREITEKLRQEAFDKFDTTDDHLMHLVGTAKDQAGTRYYITKNSWADDSNFLGGILYMSEAYLKLRTVAIMVHKDAVPKALKEKLEIK